MEIKPNNTKKFNKPVVGLALGLLTPLFCFFIYFLYLSSKQNNFGFSEFVNILRTTGASIAVLSLCVLPNLIWYFVFKKLDYWYSIKGIVTSVFVYTIFVFIVKFI